MTWARKDEEYVVDFTKITKRTLTDAEYRLFRYHFVLGADYRLCCARLKVDRGMFFHSVYRIEQKLGKAFRETEPYALFPTDEYFGGTMRNFAPPRRGEYPDWSVEQKLSNRIALPKAA